MSAEAVARRYAQAIFELGQEKGELGALGRELGAFAALYQGHPELKALASTPLVGDERRERVIRELGARLGASETGVRTLCLLARRRRLGALPAIVQKLGELVDEHERVLRASVRSAAPLAPAYLDRLRRKIEDATGKKVVIDYEEDPSLIAGIVTQLGDRVVDGSVRGKLTELGASLHRI
ncbi:MAG: ATP synthase F1 subunit delta [Deltaproteobacteria bacterium]|nr:ATP synthase F1 subunit delta [Deltaproteobacteria bacterium]